MEIRYITHRLLTTQYGSTTEALKKMSAAQRFQFAELIAAKNYAALGWFIHGLIHTCPDKTNECATIGQCEHLSTENVIN